MADFVAVIRRAVDGLSDNTPELRAKVYEKARGAVLRQLESMKPRPPEEMLRRQLDKLESAILEVESEHAEALPALDEAETITAETVTPADDGVHAPPEPASEAPPAALPENETASQPLAADEPVHPAPAEPAEEPAVQDVPAQSAPAPAPERPYLWGDEAWAGEDNARTEGPVAPEPTAYAPSYALPEAPPAVEPEPQHDDGNRAWAQEPAEPVHQPAYEPVAEPVYDAPAAAAAEADVYPDFPVEEPVAKYSQTPDSEAPVHAPAEVHDPEPVAEAVWPDGGVESTATAVEPEPWTATAEFQPGEPVDLPLEAPDGAVSDPFSWENAQRRADLVDLGPEPAAPIHVDLVSPAADLYDPPLHGHVHAEAEIEPETRGDADRYDEPVAEWVQVRGETPGGFGSEAAMPDLDPPAATAAQRVDDWDASPFSDVPLPGEGERGSGQPVQSATNEWEEFEDFKAFDQAGEEAAKQNPDPVDEFVFAPTEKPARSYRIQQRRRVDFTSIGLGLLGLLLVAGSGYGAWVFRDTLSGLVTGLVSSPPTTDSKTATAPVSTAPSTTTPATTTPAASASTPNATDANKTPAAEPAETELQKFTQRLKADGSEVDEGKPAGGSGEGEGKSVAPQTVASNAPPASGAPATGTGQPAAPAAIPAGVAQKMFLYEERVGQTSPVAIEGAVVWSLKHELADNGKNEAIVTGMVTAPNRGLSAQITVKRNLDPSLPASHLVELVFSLPKDFDGGAIDSVQRVSMKQTEQDRGDPLIAVPAKITDDFHMIALNDYADARAFNLRLLQTRNWIDIPLTYRNGRRALLTMEKGTTGMEAFSQAIREWQAEDGGPVPAASTPTTPPPSAPAQSAPAPAAQTPAANP